MSSEFNFFIADCQGLATFLKKQYGPFWGFIKYLDALFRGVGQVIFANNPWSGFIILFSLYWANIQVGFATTVAATTAILTAIVFKQDENSIVNGLTTYNAVLVGSVTSSIWQPTYNEPLDSIIWGFIVLCAALSVLVNSALTSILGSLKPSLPSFTLAFNTVTILLFTDLQPRPSSTTGRRTPEMDVILPNISNLSSPFALFRNSEAGRTEDGVEILKVIEGILLSMGQVYAVQFLPGSLAMYAAAFLYSPIVLIMSLIGATVGSFFGLVFSGPTFADVYDGIWGFNAILAAIAVGGFFFVPSPLSVALAVADVALVVLVQMALGIAFTPLHLPFLTYPFVISSILMLEVTAKGEYLVRVTKLSYPEQHLRDYMAKKLKEEMMPPKIQGEMTTSKETRMPREIDNADFYYHPSAPPLLPMYHSPNYRMSTEYPVQENWASNPHPYSVSQVTPTPLPISLYSNYPTSQSSQHIKRQ